MTEEGRVRCPPNAVVCEARVLDEPDGRGRQAVEPFGATCTACAHGVGCGGRTLIRRTVPRLPTDAVVQPGHNVRVGWQGGDMVRACLRVYALPMGLMLPAVALVHEPPAIVSGLPGAGTEPGAALAGLIGAVAGALAARVVERQAWRRDRTGPRILGPVSS